MIKKNNKQLIFQTFFMFFCLSLASQEIHTGYCGTEVPDNFFETENNNKENFEYYLAEYYSKIQSKSSKMIIFIPSGFGFAPILQPNALKFDQKHKN